ncbi:MAG TPA: hypothetical protein VM223_06240 [Planctomycetota bacterium]|nr:hypothetical protein [Planctomycetota bacterium]
MSPLWTGLIVTAFGILLTSVIAAWLTTRKKLAELDVELAMLKVRMDMQERTCTDRLACSRGMDDKLNKLITDTATIRGIVEEMHRKK